MSKIILTKKELLKLRQKIYRPGESNIFRAKVVYRLYQDYPELVNSISLKIPINLVPEPS